MEKLDSGQSCVLVLIDIDELKTVNECFGFAEGDVVLQKISEFLNSQLESPDFMFRISGDEFALAFFWKKCKNCLEKNLRMAQQNRKIRTGKRKTLFCFIFLWAQSYKWRK